MLQMLEFAEAALSHEIIEDAWQAFHDFEVFQPYDPFSELNSLFIAWYLFNFKIVLKNETTSETLEGPVAKLFLDEFEAELTPDEKSVLVSALNHKYSFYEVMDIKPGIGMTQFDLLRNVTHFVTDPVVSSTLELGHIIYSSAIEWSGITGNHSVGPYVLAAAFKPEVLRLRRILLAQTGQREITDEDLVVYESDIRWLYLQTVPESFSSLPITIEENDLLLQQQLENAAKEGKRVTKRVLDNLFMAAAAGEGPAHASSAIQEDCSIAPDDPEVRAALKEAAEDYWEEWLAEEIPALNGMTPREAAKRAEGRKLLESLFLDFESSKVPEDPFEPDIPYLRRQLGL